MTTYFKSPLVNNPLGLGKQLSDHSSHIQIYELDFKIQSDRKIIKQVFLEWKSQKKKLNTFSQQQRSILDRILKCIEKYFSYKNFNLQVTLDALQTCNNIINLYERNPWPLKFSDPFIKHTEKCFVELDEMYTDKIRNSECNQQIRKEYQNKFNPLLYFLIIFIAKVQKERNQATYKTILTKLLKKDNRKILICLPLFKEEANLKFYGAILGHIGENYILDKLHNQLVKKMFQTFQKLSHQKTLYYIVNFIRQKSRNMNFRQNQVDGNIMIPKFKKMIKDRFQSNQYQIATILDLYTNIYNENRVSFPNQFYDQQIFSYVLNPQSGLTISYPTTAYKTIYYNASKKYINFMIKSQINGQQLNKKVLLNENLIKYFEQISVSQINFEQIVGFIEKIFENITEDYLFTLIDQGLLDLIIKLLNYGDTITINGLNIVKKIIKKIQNQAYGLKFIVSMKLIQKIEQLTENTHHFSISQQAKSIKQSFKDMCKHQNQMLMVLE